MYSLHCIDPLKLLFYPSSAQAREAAAQDPKTRKKKPSIIRRLPKPAMSFHPWPDGPHSPRWDSFSLVGRHGVVLADYSRKCNRAAPSAALYDTGRGVFASIPPPNSGKVHPLGMSFPMIQDETEDDPSLYVIDLSCYAEMDTCFEVLARRDGAWCWRTLPGPPFLSHSAPRPAIQICSYTAVDDGSTICISTIMRDGICTYAFDTASHAWRQLGQWALPFHGKAEYVPELKLWVSLLLDYGNPLPSPRLGVFDLSAVDAAQHPPTPQRAWDYLGPGSHSVGGDNKHTSIPGLHLVNLGSGKFCIGTHISITWSRPCTSGDDDMSTTDDSSSWNSEPEPEMPMMDIIRREDFLVLTGVEVKRCSSCEGLQMIKHKSRRYDFRLLPMVAVL
ncbi:hypothetical protein QYE76_036163 [Lolium multiflorum]|uniref:Uncharacterized protein n=1 Tax=Lolium multiflorum TaxID=4521 RepID=A0AAD8R1W2_LOLMU|nr:hypothetical protein QYE76_036163 [Lolium multiflorum]